MTFFKAPGGVCAPAGFVAAGISAGIKSSGELDLALLVSEKPASAAGVFTRNLAAAAPVLVSKGRLGVGPARGVVVNSGCANACTGEQGTRDAREMADLAAEAAGLQAPEMLVCSTGLIGSFLPMDRLRKGVKAAAARLRHNDEEAARAIMTTDSRPKRVALSHPTGWSIGGIAKGAGMIAPNMATMLAFLTTDAVVPSGRLAEILPEAVDGTFNAISIDGDTSTNDTVLAFANGASGMTAAPEDFKEGIGSVCRSLAELIVADGEGISKVIRVSVTGAADDREARLAARAIAESTLVKTAVYGADANWGRVVAAAGSSGARLDLDRLSIRIAGVTLFEHGSGAGAEAAARARAAMSSAQIDVDCDLGAGPASSQMLSADLTPEYVKLNAAYES